MTQNCIPIRVTRLKNRVYIVALTDVETITLLQKSSRKRKPDTRVKFSLDMENYYQIKNAEGDVKIK